MGTWREKVREEEKKWMKRSAIPSRLYGDRNIRAVLDRNDSNEIVSIVEICRKKRGKITALLRPAHRNDFQFGMQPPIPARKITDRWNR